MALNLEKKLPDWNEETLRGFCVNNLLWYKISEGKTWDDISADLDIPKRTIMHWVSGTKMSRVYAWYLIKALPTYKKYKNSRGWFSPPTLSMRRAVRNYKRRKKRHLPKRPNDR